MFKTLTALYVEDEEKIKNIVSNFLENFFYKVLLAKDGDAGLKLFTENKDTVSIVITGINMPKMNGLDMSEAIREINPSIPIIITSARNDKDFLHKAISLGVSEFVTKPINMKTLIYSIKKNIKPILLRL
jgi:YesN/AraC family two-component response regulator